MNLFSVYNDQSSSSAKAISTPVKSSDVKSPRAPARHRPTPDEIRQKLAAHQESKNPKISSKAKQLNKSHGENIKTYEGSVPPEMNIIKTNDPNDPVMRMKLQEALKSGEINFSQREKEVLGKILSS